MCFWKESANQKGGEKQAVIYFYFIYFPDIDHIIVHMKWALS